MPQIHSDGIALHLTGKYTTTNDRQGGPTGGGWLYWQALTGRTLYRAPLSALKDASLSPEQLAQRVENLGTTVVTDGMEVDADGTVYFSALEHDAIIVRRADGTMETLVHSPLIAWPDSFAWSRRDGGLVFTTAQIHRTPPFASAMPQEPYRLFKVRPLRRPWFERAGWEPPTPAGEPFVPEAPHHAESRSTAPAPRVVPIEPASTPAPAAATPAPAPAAPPAVPPPPPAPDEPRQVPPVPGV